MSRPTLQRIRSDQFGTFYVVRDPDLTQQLELTLSEVT